jgi:nucleoid-associated protein EbfC
MNSFEDMMKAAQQAAANVQAQMAEAQAKLDSVEVEGVSGGGMVRIRASAKGRIIAISIDDELMVPGDKQMLEDLLAAAFNDAREKADAASNEELSKATADLQLPPGFKLPF